MLRVLYSRVANGSVRSRVTTPVPTSSPDIPVSHFRHDYVIKSLGRLPGLFKPHRYVYLCIRCKWSFVVNDGQRGVITAVDHELKPLVDHKAGERLATFGAGPCPELEILNRKPPIPERPAIRLAMVGNASKQRDVRREPADAT
jgi:hypothetical protein